MVWAHQGLAAVTKTSAVVRLFKGTFCIGKGIGGIDGLYPGRTALKYEAPSGVVQLIGIGLTLGAKVGREVFSTQQGAADSGASDDDVAHVHHAKCRFANWQYFCRSQRDAQGLLHAGDGLVQCSHLF